MWPWILSIASAVVPAMAVFLLQRSIKKRDAVREGKAEAARKERREAEEARLLHAQLIFK